MALTPGAFRDRFHIPHLHGNEAAYFTGNSLGLMPKAAREAVAVELDDWAKYGVEGHFEGRNPWFHYHKFVTEGAAAIVGGLAHEVVVMNNLTVNLHLMMVSFYRPTPTRFKILMEGGAFPSDQYAAETQARFHGYDPAEAIVELMPRDGEHTLRTEDIEAAIVEHGPQLALVLLGGVNYYTGQAFAMEAITKAGHAAGAMVGFDLAHAAGNLHLHLHEWGPDFAVWCGYKYLNSGPGGASGVFVHERHAHVPTLPRFGGWWGHDESSRFQMKKGFMPMHGAEGWQLSNAQVLPLAVHKASLALFEEAGGMATLHETGMVLHHALRTALEEVQAAADGSFTLITPREAGAHGQQLSLLVHTDGKALFAYLQAQGIIADWREPNVIRMAPVPLYNTLDDVERVRRAFNTFYRA